jgi:hypothetical protein
VWIRVRWRSRECGRGNYNQNILYEKNLFSIKIKIRGEKDIYIKKKKTFWVYSSRSQFFAKIKLQII